MICFGQGSGGLGVRLGAFTPEGARVNIVDSRAILRVDVGFYVMGRARLLLEGPRLSSAYRNSDRSSNMMRSLSRAPYRNMTPKVSYSGSYIIYELPRSQPWS